MALPSNGGLVGRRASRTHGDRVPTDAGGTERDRRPGGPAPSPASLTYARPDRKGHGSSTIGSVRPIRTSVRRTPSQSTGVLRTLPGGFALREPEIGEAQARIASLGTLAGIGGRVRPVARNTRPSRLIAARSSRGCKRP